MAKVADVVISDLKTGELTVRVRVTRRFKFKVWIGIRLLRLGAWLMPFNVSIEVKDA